MRNIARVIFEAIITLGMNGGQNTSSVKFRFYVNSFTEF